MNNFNIENLLVLAKKRNKEEVNSQFVQKALQSSPTNRNRWLATLGIWMIAIGEKLQDRYTTSLQTNQLMVSQSEAKKARV